MPSTESRFGWPVPEDTDPLADGAAAMRQLADGISSTLVADLVAGDFAGRRWRLVAARIVVPKASSGGTWAWDISAYGFTDRPVARLPIKANKRLGPVLTVNLGNNPGSAAVLNIMIVDAEAQGTSVDTDVYLDAILLGPVS